LAVFVLLCAQAKAKNAYLLVLMTPKSPLTAE
jgi:hypothetical protein